MIRAVLDTNVLASGILGFEHSSKPPAEILRRWYARTFGLVASSDILQELTRTLGNPYFSQRVSPAEAAQSVIAIQKYAELPEITHPTVAIATHPEDDLILAAAVSAHVDYLVTGDKHLQALRQHAGIEIVSPGRFVEILDASLMLPLDKEQTKCR